MKKGEALAQEWRRSGLSQKDFCKDRGIKLSSLRYWLYRKKAGEVKPYGFREIRETGTVEGLPQTGLFKITVAYPNGVRLEGSLSLEQVEQVVKLY